MNMIPRMVKGGVGAVALLLLAVFLPGCGGGAVEKQEITWVWPLPPEEPRIKYLDSFAANTDVEETAGLTKQIFGDEEEIRLLKPYGAAADAEGRIYVTDLGAVFVFDKKNRKFSRIGVEPGLGRLGFPVGIAVARDGRKFVTDISQDRVFVYGPNNKYLTAYGSKSEFSGPSSVVLDETRGRFYVADSKLHLIRAYGFDGKVLFTIEGRSPSEGQFNYPTNIALDSAGNIYVVDTGNFRVQVFSPEGKYVRSIGSIGAQVGTFTRPKGIAVDSEDNIYVVDAAFQNVQVFNPQGKLLLFFGSAGLGPGRFYLPAGIAIDAEDRIYVVDQLGRNVQVFQYMGEKWKKRQAAGPPK